jgi:hypothetical protein
VKDKLEHRERLRVVLEIASSLVLIAIALGGVWFSQRGSTPAPQPQKIVIEIERAEQLSPPGPMGWSPDCVQDQAEWTDQQARFQIISKGTGEPVSQDNEHANVRLWKLTQLNVAQPPPNGPQLIGDCTSWSGSHAVEGTEGAELAALGQGKWQRIFPPWLYGAGRQWVWKQNVVGPLPDEGCSVGAIARAAQQYGVLSWDDAKAAGYEYSAQLARDWGRNGPPAKLKELAAAHKIGSPSPMRSADDVRDAICNGYGVAVGSDFTTGDLNSANGRDAYKIVDGRIVAENIAPRLGIKQRWHHALCIDGYDGTGSQPYFHIQNSWYPTSHPAPIDDSPVCGFWVVRATVAYMVSQGDGFAFPDFEGFVDRKEVIDLFNLTSPAEPSRDSQGAFPAKTRMSP